MKILKLFNTALIMNSLLVTPLLLPIAQAQSDRPGGGGDARTEMRMDEIRADLLKWIIAGGAKDLVLPESITYKEYEQKMLGALQPLVVVLGSISNREQNSSDLELNTAVSGQPKTCKGFASRKDFKLHIICNPERFTALSTMEQYRQIHHEFAGLVKIERNRGAASDYSVSQQITDYLRPEKVMRLAVLPRGTTTWIHASNLATCAGGLITQSDLFRNRPVTLTHFNKFIMIHNLNNGAQVQIPDVQLTPFPGKPFEGEQVQWPMDEEYVLRNKISQIEGHVEGFQSVGEYQSFMQSSINQIQQMMQYKQQLQQSMFEPSFSLDYPGAPISRLLPIAHGLAVADVAVSMKSDFDQTVTHQTRVAFEFRNHTCKLLWLSVAK